MKSGSKQNHCSFGARGAGRKAFPGYLERKNRRDRVDTPRTRFAFRSLQLSLAGTPGCFVHTPNSWIPVSELVCLLSPSDTMSLTATYHLAQACLCSYTGYLSYTAIQKLLLYEERTEQAAQYSHTAADQLHKTRTTQASGAVAVRAYEPRKPTTSVHVCVLLC